MHVTQMGPYKTMKICSNILGLGTEEFEVCHMRIVGAWKSPERERSLLKLQSCTISLGPPKHKKNDCCVVHFALRFL